MTDPNPRIHAGATVQPGASVGDGTIVWDGALVRSGAVVGRECTIGRGVYVDAGVVVGDRCKIQDNALLYQPARIGDGVFVGPAVILTNDRHPRAVSPEGELLDAEGWHAEGVEVLDGAALGAASVVVAGRRIGRWALVAAGAIVTTNVEDHALVAGNPARRIGWVGRSGRRLRPADDDAWMCPSTGEVYRAAGEGLALTDAGS